ncbi:helix-turn-helix domain-containing protein, partial [Methylobacterium dankookense]
MTEADQDVSRQVRILRQASGLTLVEMASALGISWQQMHKHETGGSRIGAGRFQAIANLFGVPVSAFLDGDVERVASRPDLELLAKPGALEHLQLYAGASDDASRRSILALVTAAAHVCPPSAL